MISVIVPIFNTMQAYLERCIASLCVQTHDDYEVLLVDDGSNERVEAYCQAAAQCYPQLRVIRIPHAGVSVARNTGVEHAQGDYLAFVDSDDWVDSNYIAHLNGAAQRLNAEVIITNATVERAESTISNSFIQGGERLLNAFERNELFYQVFGTHDHHANYGGMSVGVSWAKLIKRSFLLEHQLQFVPGMARGEDKVFALWLFEHASRIGFSPDSGYHYYMYEQSSSQRYDPDVVAKMESMYRACEAFLVEQHKDQSLFDALAIMELRSFNTYFKCYYFHDNYPASFSQARREICQMLDRQPYASALDSLNFAQLDSLEKVFFFCLRHRLIALLYVLEQVRNRALFRS